MISVKDGLKLLKRFYIAGACLNWWWNGKINLRKTPQNRWFGCGVFYIRICKRLLFILILIVVEPTINTVLNFWLQRLFNSAVPGADKIYVMQLLTAGFLFWILKRLLTFFNSVLKARYICNTKLELKHQLFTKLFYADTSYILNEAASGDYISIFTNDISLIEQRFFNQVISLISGIVSVLILGISFAVLNVKLAVSIFSVGIAAMLIPVFFEGIK